MGKTERILSYLPPIYRPYRPEQPKPPTVLFTVADAVGRRLLEADNLLFEVMRAHWVDFADQGAGKIHDLALMAALFALEPRADEDVETFRTHLKSYIRTYLEGSATLKGVLRLAASTLALSIEDPLEPQPGDPLYLVDTIHPGDDATFKLFGFKAGEAHGVPPAPARLVGGRDLSAGVDLSSSNTLQLEIDGDKIATVDVAGGEVQAASLWDVTRRINSALHAPVAEHDGHTLALTSETAGPDAEIQIGSPTGDAADALLGAAPRSYQGSDAQPAQVRGTRDHAPAGGLPFVNLSHAHYLRLAIDGVAPIEVDCTGADPAATTLDEVRDAINTATGAAVASHDGHFLTLTSPTVGAASRLELLPAPANDARDLLLGPAVRRLGRGANATPARLVGRSNLSLGVDLSVRHILRLRLDGGEAQEIDCAGDHPDATALSEIAARINAVLGAGVASDDGRYLILTSPTSGAASAIEVLTPTDKSKDATETILGVIPRSYQGAPPGPARLSGLIALQEPLDMRSQRRLWLAIDGGPLIAIDCAGPDPAHTTIQHVVDAINHAAGTTIAFAEENRLILQSTTKGADSALLLRAPEASVRRYFYTRGRVREDAATTLFGTAAARATGVLPQPARLIGTVDLTRGADLRVAHTLRLQIDDRDPIDIRVANPDRPLVTLLTQTPGQPPHWNIVNAINAALGAPVASPREGKLELISPTEGPEGRIAVGVSTASDAGQILFGLPAGTRAQGSAAERVQFVGMGDLARGLDVTATYRLRVSIDGHAPADIDLRTAVPQDSPPILSPGQVVAALNQALGGNYASHDGRHIILTSQLAGRDSKLRVEPAGTGDATVAVFGLSAAREYSGQDATAARLIGLADLSHGVDLRARRHLSLVLDGRPLADIDCAGADPAHTSLDEIVQRIDTAAGRTIAGQVDGHLVILSPSSGATSVIALAQSSAADARQRLLGDAPAIALGLPGQPAVLTGLVKLNRPADLSRRAVIRLRVDGGEQHDVDCAGEHPERTFPDEVVAKINAVFPGLAAVDAQRRLVLTAALRVELLALRYFTVFEYAPVERRTPDQPLHDGATWSVVNESVRDEPAEWVLTSLSGVDRPRLTNRDTHAWLQVNTVVPAGMTLHVYFDDEGQVRAWTEGPGRIPRDLTGAVETRGGPSALLLPIGESHWTYSDCYGDRYNSAYYGKRPRRGRPPKLTYVPAHYAGGATCHSPGVYDLSRFYDPDNPATESVYGSRAAGPSQATSAFVYQSHQAGRFELQLPADLPPQLGGRFNTARYAERDLENGRSTSYILKAAIFDLPEDPNAVDEQIKARPGPVTARVELIPDEGVPVYDVPFNNDRSLVGGDAEHYARAYLRQPGVPGVVELRANEIGDWGNLIRVAAPESEVPGAFNITITYTGRDVFENAREKVAQQIAFARAAGVLAEVTRR